MKLKDMKQEDLSAAEVSSQVIKINNEGGCTSLKYFCPKIWIKVKDLEDGNVKEEYLAYLGFLEKTKTLTINLYAEYVNLFDQNNGLFKISYCYSINEITKSDFISQHFCSFLEFINLNIKNCTELNTSEDLTRHLESFYSYFNIFLKENFQFITTNDLKQLEMRIKDQTKIYHLENIDFQIEKKFLEYMATVESIISMMIERLNLSPEDHGGYEIERTVSNGLQMLTSKVAKHRDIRFVKNDTSIEHHNKSHDNEKMDLHKYYDELDVDYYEHPSYLYVDNFFDVKNDEQKFEQESKDLLKKFSSYDLTINHTDQFSNTTYESVFSTEYNPFITKNFTAPNLENKGTSNIVFSWSFFLVTIGVGVVTCLVGFGIALYCYFDKQVKVEEEQEEREMSAENIELLVKE